jgi:hypothetical protein
MYKPRNIKGGLLRIGAAILCFYFAWDHWQQIAAFEAGHDITVKMWAPLAMIYNLGGAWTAVAKWVGHIFTLLFGVVFVFWAASDLRRQNALAQPIPARRLP